MLVLPPLSRTLDGHAHTEIGQPDAPPMVQQHVVHFDVTVREMMPVHVLEGGAQLCEPLVRGRLRCVVVHLVEIVH